MERINDITEENTTNNQRITEEILQAIQNKLYKKRSTTKHFQSKTVATNS